MTNHAETPDGTAPGSPVLFIADADRVARVATESALTRRFGPDYQVVAVDSAAAGLGALARLARQGAEVALVAADLRLPETDAVEFLHRARTLHPSASRALLVAMDRRGTRIPFGELASLQRATAHGRIDFWVVKGGGAPEELLYPQV